MEDYRKLAAKLRICHNPDVDCDGCEDEQVEGCIHKNIGLAADAIENLLTENAALRQQEHFREVTKKVEPLTNAQKIRAMTDEELVNFLMRMMGHAQCFAEGIFPYHPCPQEQNCKQCGIDWLQQPAGEEDKHESN